MACKKSELVQAIQTYSTARVSQDPNLINYAAQLLDQYLESIEFEEEPAPEEVPQPQSDT